MLAGTHVSPVALVVASAVKLAAWSVASSVTRRARP